MSAPRRYFLVAGEPSGDRLGAALMAGLRKLSPVPVEFYGVGGPMMAEQGLDSLFPMDELSIMGLAEVLPKLRGLFKRVAETAQAVTDSGAPTLVTIDSPDFCFRVAQRAKAANPALRTVHYVAPSVWAWRPGRAAKMARYVDHVLTLLPFEPPYMQAAGMTADFVGHPVVAEPQASAAEADAFRAQHGIDPARPLLTLLPGSRGGEVSYIGPVFRTVLEKLRAEMPDLQTVIPSVGPRVEQIAATFDGLPVTILDPRGLPVEMHEAHKRAALGASAAALAASGTVSLELAAAGVPMVIAYKKHWLTAAITKRLVKVSTVTLVNLVTETAVIPEHLLDACTPENILPDIRHLLVDPAAGARQKQAMRDTMQALGQGAEAPGLRAARSVLAFEG